VMAASRACLRILMVEPAYASLTVEPACASLTVERWRPFSRAFVTSPIGREFDRLTLTHMMDER